GPERKMRARDLIDIHWRHTGPDLWAPSEAYYRIMSCIIDHANAHTGRCNPSYDALAIATRYSVENVKRVVRWWRKYQFLETESRGLGKSLAFHPQWDLFDSMWVEVEEDIKSQKQDHYAIRGDRRRSS